MWQGHVDLNVFVGGQTKSLFSAAINCHTKFNHSCLIGYGSKFIHTQSDTDGLPYYRIGRCIFDDQATIITLLVAAEHDMQRGSKAIKRGNIMHLAICDQNHPRNLICRFLCQKRLNFGNQPRTAIIICISNARLTNSEVWLRAQKGHYPLLCFRSLYWPFPNGLRSCFIGYNKHDIFQIVSFFAHNAWLQQSQQQNG